MSKFASFGMVIILFLLLSVTVLFGFFIFAPEVKAYRALDIALEEKSSELERLEAAFDKKYALLQSLQESEAAIDRALHQHFDEDTFESYVKQFFKGVQLRSIVSEKDGRIQTDLVTVVGTITSPKEYYRFIDALNRFTWVAEIEGTQRFKGKPEGIEASFNLKVYTKVD